VLRTRNGGVSWQPQLVDDTPLRDLVSSYPSVATALTGGARILSPSYEARSSYLTLNAVGLPNHRVRVSGTLSPDGAGAKVAILWRIAGERRWRHRFVTTGPAGGFGLTVTDHASDPRIDFVAQWIGDQKLRGAGSPRVSARPRP